MKHLSLNKKEYLELKKLYNQAVSENKEVFIFQDSEIAVGYTKYLIEYLSKHYE